MKKEQKVSRIEITCRFSSKDLDSPNIVVLSEEVKATVLNLSDEKSYRYCIHVSNDNKTDKSTWENLSFEIKPSMKLSHYINQDIDGFHWFTEKSIYFLDVLLEETNERLKFNFWKILKQCLCSIDKNIPIQRASVQANKTSKAYIKDYGNIINFNSHVEDVCKKYSKEKEQKEKEKQLINDLKNLQICQPKIDEILNLSVSKKIFSKEGELYNCDTINEKTIEINKKVVLNVYKLDSQRFDYILCTETPEGNLYTIDKISSDINAQVVDSPESKSFFWITNKYYIKLIGNCMAFIFGKVEEFNEFKNLYYRWIYETNNRRSYEEMEEENRKILERVNDYNHIDCFSEDESEEKEKEEKEEKKSKKRSKKNRKELMDIDDGFNEVESSKEKINKFCLDSLSNDRTFCVTEDNQIVVYKANENDTIEKLSTMPVVQEYEGKNVCFSQGLLFKGENNMLLLDENDPYTLYQYDLPKEKIVSVWNTDKTYISDICPMKRGGQKTDDPMLYGVNPKSVFTMDERINKKNRVVDIKMYTQKNNANKILSTQDGQFVTGSKDGDIRFYDRIGVKAKNLFSFYGDPIRHIDLSSDDHYILLTCDKYLLLLGTEGDENDKNAFLRTIKTIDRKTPIRLQVSTKDLSKYGLTEANYTKAKFNMNKNGENNIITSLGEYVIIWNYNDIRKGKFMNYKIKKVNDLVIDNYFKAGTGNKILVAMPTKVRIQNQKKIFG